MLKTKQQNIIDLNKAEESAKDLESHPIEVEKILYLKRQAENSGIKLKEDKLKEEQHERNVYNNSLKSITDTFYIDTIVPVGYTLIKLFKKPIFELNGFLKPDLIKRKSEGGGIEYIENRFPYLDAGIVVVDNGIEKHFGVDSGQGSVVTLKPMTDLAKYVYFIDKTDITPTYFEGYVCVPTYELETIICHLSSPNYNQVVGKLLGQAGQLQLQTKLDNEADETTVEDQTT